MGWLITKDQPHHLEAEFYLDKPRADPTPISYQKYQKMIYAIQDGYEASRKEAPLDLQFSDRELMRLAKGAMPLSSIAAGIIPPAPPSLRVAADRRRRLEHRRALAQKDFENAVWKDSIKLTEIKQVPEIETYVVGFGRPILSTWRGYTQLAKINHRRTRQGKPPIKMQEGVWSG